LDAKEKYIMLRTDTIVKKEGMKTLLDNLGHVDAERFISLIIREPFDYTAWRSNLQEENISLRELSHKAMEFCGKKDRLAYNRQGEYE